jgi:hypothetical protein
VGSEVITSITYIAVVRAIGVLCPLFRDRVVLGAADELASFRVPADAILFFATCKKCPCMSALAAFHNIDDMVQINIMESNDRDNPE